MTAQAIFCTNCKFPYPPRGLPYQCPKCGGLFDFFDNPVGDFSKVDRSQPGIWRYRSTFGLSEKSAIVTLGEGNTPLIPARVGKREIYFKCEYQNPTGSFKDRGSALIAAWVRERGMKQAVEDSSGNAGASFAAYGARAGFRTRIFIPALASGPKRRQIEAYGAALEPIPGSRSDVADSVRDAVDEKTAYASHAWLPFNLPGYATAAYEIYEQLGNHLPGSVIVPVGQGGFLLGLSRGFEAIRVANIPGGFKPRMVGVQARACAPVWAVFTYGREGLGFVAENPTLAEGVRVFRPLRTEALLRSLSDSGTMIAVDEVEIMAGQKALARLGFFVEPTSALVWSALEQNYQDLPDPIVVVLTGSGLKYG